MAIIVVLLLAGCRTLLFGALNTTDQRRGIEIERQQAFAPAQHLDLDVYRPAHAAHAPVMVFFYGGDWTHGERGWYRFVGTALAAQGVITIIPDYRKYPRVRLDGFMQDAAHAVAWAHGHAAQLGGDPRDLFVMGHSSGAQIAALLATDPTWLKAEGMSLHSLAGLIGLAGVFDFVPIPPQDAGMRNIFGSLPGEQRRADPITFVQRGDPPMLLLQGSDDHEVGAAGSVSLARKAQAVGDDAELKFYPGVGHMALLFVLSRPLRQHASTLCDVLTFVRAHSRTSPAGFAGTASLPRQCAQ